MAEELKACPCCHQPASPYGWKSAGCMNPDCMLTGMWFEWDIWQRKRAQLPSQGGEAVAWAICKEPGNVDWLSATYTNKRAAEAHVASYKDGMPLYVAPLYTHPADQVAEPANKIAWKLRDGIMGCKRFMTQKCYDGQSPQMKGNYEPFYCAHCVAEPGGVVVARDKLQGLLWYADQLLADVNAGARYAGCTAADAEHSDADYLELRQLLADSGEVKK